MAKRINFSDKEGRECGVVMRAADHPMGQARFAERTWCGKRSLKGKEKSKGQGCGVQAQQSRSGELGNK